MTDYPNLQPPHPTHTHTVKDLLEQLVIMQLVTKIRAFTQLVIKIYYVSVINTSLFIMILTKVGHYTTFSISCILQVFKQFRNRS